MKSAELFEIRLEGQALQSALDLRDADKRLAAEVAPLIKQAGELQQQLMQLQSQIESKYVQFDELRVAFFQALEITLSRDLEACSLSFLDEEGAVLVHRTQEDIDRLEAIRAAQQNPLALLQKAVEDIAAGEAEVTILGADGEELPAANVTRH